MAHAAAADSTALSGTSRSFVWLEIAVGRNPRRNLAYVVWALFVFVSRATLATRWAQRAAQPI